MQEVLNNCDSCDWNINGEDVSCGPGGNSCFYAKLLSPIHIEKAFHPPSLKGATTAINAILDTVRQTSSSGLQLCFLKVQGGIMLAWVTQDGPIAEDAITPYSDPEAIKLAVGLIEPERN